MSANGRESVGSTPRIDLPDGWSQVSMEDEGLLLAARPTGPSDRLAPLLTVTRVRLPDSVDFDRYVVGVLSDAEQAPDAHVVHARLGDDDSRQLEVGVACMHGGVDVTVYQRHQFGEGVAVVASVTVPDTDWAELSSSVLEAVQSFRIEP